MKTEKMVGHQITAMHRRNVQQASKRGENAAIRARKISGLAMTKRQKTRLIQAAVIPAATAGTLWDIPPKKALNSLRTEIMNATWGKGRKLTRLRFRAVDAILECLMQFGLFGGGVKLGLW